jgi:hypothetical protein
MTELEVLVSKINKSFEDFTVESTSLLAKGNKTAGQRARVMTTKVIQPLLKEFRSLSTK